MARQFTWLPADGGQPVALSDRSNGYRVLAAGTRGLDAPTYRMTVGTYAGLAGGQLQALEADVRDVSLGLSIEATTAADFRNRKRALIRAMRPKAGDGVLQVDDEYGMTRSLNCRYVSGLEGDAESYFDGKAWRAIVHFTALDPWFYGDMLSLDVGLGVGAPFFPIFPLVLAPSQVQGQFTVDLSDTDTPSFPVWTITGPGTSLTLTNNTTGKSIVVNATLTAGQTMVIDSRPGRQSVRRGDGTNLMGSLSSDPALWPLIEGVNSVTAALAGATTASRITGVYQPRYAGI